MRPIFSLLSLTSGADLTGALLDRLVRLRVVDVEGIESDTLEIEIDDRDGRIQLPSTGERLHLLLGYTGIEIADMGRFVVDEIGVSGPPMALTVSAKGADMLGGLKTPKMDFFHDTVLGDLVRKIASQQDLKAEVHDDVNNIPVPHVDQMGESDLALLTRLASQNDLSLKIDAEKVAVRPHASKLIAYGKGAVGSIHIRGREISRYQWESTSRTKYGAVKASYYDRDLAQRVPVTVGDPDAGPTLELRHDAHDAEEAARIASARVEQLARGTGSLKLTVPGRPGLRAGMVALVSGLRDGLNGTWVIERAEHTLDTKGYVTTASCVPPGKTSEGKSNSIQDWFGYLEEMVWTPPPERVEP